MKNIKIIKYNIIFILVILAILALNMIMIPSETNAQYYDGGYVGNGGYVVSKGYTPSANYNQYNPTPVYVNTYQTAPVVKTNTTDSNTTTTKTTTTNNSTNTSGNNSNLAANAVFGSNSFIPSRLIQWVIVAILILFIVVLVRRIYGGAERYHSTPLKHS